MNPIVLKLLQRGAVWWLRNRPLSKEKREIRKVRRKNKQRAKHGLPLLVEEEKIGMFALLASLRTSTKAGVTGLITYIVMNFVPADVLAVVESFFSNAATADGGAVPFVIAAVVSYVAARVSKTPDSPGVL